MENTNMIIAIIMTLAAIGAVIAAYHYKKKNLNKLFEQAYEYAKQVPRQKKNSVLILMFMEAVTASKKSLNRLPAITNLAIPSISKSN